MINILKNPAYAGLRLWPASPAYGGNPAVAEDQDAGVAPEDWSICLKDAHPAYLDWDEFMANRRQLADNVGRYDAGRPGAP